MNKSELINAISERVDGASKKVIGEVVEALTASITSALKKNDTVSLIGFGTFKVTSRNARNGRNPRTGATIKIAAAKKPSFTAGKALKDAVNSK